MAIGILRYRAILHNYFALRQCSSPGNFSVNRFTLFCSAEGRHESCAVDGAGNYLKTHTCFSAYLFSLAETMEVSDSGWCLLIHYQSYSRNLFRVREEHQPS